MPSDLPHGPTSPQGFFSVLDRITHLPSVLLLLASVLAADSALSWKLNTSLLSLSWNVIQQQLTIGDGVVFLLSFGILMATCLAVLRYTADFVIQLTVLRIWKKLFPSDDNLSPPYAHAVRSWQLCKSAYMEQNKFYFDRYKEHQHSSKDFQGTIWRLASNAFACLVFFGINSLVLPSYGYTSISQELGSHAPDLWDTVSTLLTLGLVSLWLFPMFRDDRYDDWVYCPPLAHQLAEARDKARVNKVFPNF